MSSLMTPTKTTWRENVALVLTLFAAGMTGTLIGNTLTENEPDCAWHTVTVEAHGADPWKAGAESMPIRVCLDEDGHVR